MAACFKELETENSTEIIIYRQVDINGGHLLKMY